MRGMKWSLGLIGGLVAIGFALWQISRARCFVLTGEITCRIETDRKLVALTLDDGPTVAGLDAALPVLAAHDATATFFLIGHEVERQPGLVRRIVADGHEIGNHSYTHDMMVGHPAAFYDAEIVRTHHLLVRAGAPAPRLFRPPYGKKLWGLPRAVERHGYRMIMIDVEEPETTDPRAYAGRLVAQAKPGSILLMHLMYRTNRTAREALPLVLDGLQARGFRVVTVGELRRQAR